MDAPAITEAATSAPVAVGTAKTGGIVAVMLIVARLAEKIPWTKLAKRMATGSAPAVSPIVRQNDLEVALKLHAANCAQALNERFEKARKESEERFEKNLENDISARELFRSEVKDILKRSEEKLDSVHRRMDEFLLRGK